MIAAIQVLAGGHYPSYEVLKQPIKLDASAIPQESFLVDSNNDSCASLRGPELATLQAIINFPKYNANNNIRVDVLTRDVVDCSSPAWTWFVGSRCAPTRFLECHGNSIDTPGVFSRCRVTCYCPSFELCEYIHFKYTFDNTDMHMNGTLCAFRVWGCELAILWN